MPLTFYLHRTAAHLTIRKSQAISVSDLGYPFLVPIKAVKGNKKGSRQKRRGSVVSENMYVNQYTVAFFFKYWERFKMAVCS